MDDTLQSKMSAEGPESVPVKGKEPAEGAQGGVRGRAWLSVGHRLPEPAHRQRFVWVDTYVARGEPVCSSHMVGTADGRETLPRSSLWQ